MTFIFRAWLVRHKHKPQRYPVKDLAGYLRVSLKTIYNWMSGQRKFNPDYSDEIEKYINAKRIQNI